MEALGVIGFCLGTVGFVCATAALAQIAKLEAQLREKGVIEEESKPA